MGVSPGCGWARGTLCPSRGRGFLPRARGACERHPVPGVKAFTGRRREGGVEKVDIWIEQLSDFRQVLRSAGKIDGPLGAYQVSLTASPYSSLYEGLIAVFQNIYFVP